MHAPLRPRAGTAQLLQHTLTHAQVLRSGGLHVLAEGGVGWVDIDDLVGPGISTTHPRAELTQTDLHAAAAQTPSAAEVRSRSVWLGHAPFEFRYYPGAPLSTSLQVAHEERCARGEMRALTAPEPALLRAAAVDVEREKVDARSRQREPLHELEFRFLRDSLVGANH